MAQESFAAAAKAARLAIAGLMLLGAVAVARADGIQVKSAELNLVEEVYQLNAEFEISFSKSLEDAINKGVPLNFIVEFELTRPRPYWWDEEIARVQQDSRLSYHALTRQYQLSINSRHKSFNSLAEATSELNKVREWQVVDRSLLKKRYIYVAAVRMKLDASQLPKPLQLGALGSKEWSLVSEWRRWNLAP